VKIKNMETEKLSKKENKTNGDAQLTMVEMGEVNHCSRPSISGENKRSG